MQIEIKKMIEHQEVFNFTAFKAARLMLIFLSNLNFFFTNFK